MIFANSGLPTVRAWKELVHQPLYQELAIASKRFTADHHKDFTKYHRFGVRDIYQMFGRDWEYAFVYYHLQQSLHNKTAPRILDAGCGFTFFPFQVAKTITQSQVIGVDMDPQLSDFYRDPSSGVQLLLSDIRKLPFPDASFDAIYCVSVLEHTSEYATIADEFKRLLKPGGACIVTFDISTDGCSDISVPAAQKFVADLADRFQFPAGITAQNILQSLNENEALLDANYYRQNAKERLPWAFPHLSALKASLLRGKLRFNLELTFCCLTMTKV